jgi:RNA recognition motif-containing protein
MQIFVGNLSFATTEDDLKKLFSEFGGVVSVTILKNKDGKKSRGFGFVEMADERAAYAAIAGLNAKDFMERPLNVMVAKPKPAKPPEPVAPRKKEFRFRPNAEDRLSHQRKGFRKSKGFKPADNRADDRKSEARPGRFARKPDKFAPKPRSRFNTGRRSASYTRKMGAGEEQSQSRPWQRSERPARSSRPWQKSDGSKPWQRSESAERPERKPKPWERSDRPKKPWTKEEGAARPWKKTGDKPWRKSSGPERKFRPAARKRQ